jgi:hypothetical protein
MRIGAWAKKHVVSWAVSNRRCAEIGDTALQKIVGKFDRLTVQAQDVQRIVAASQRSVRSEIFNFDRTAHLSVSVMSPHAPWLSVVPSKINTPAMITYEEAQYYTYLGSFYEGRGRVVELGPWLGVNPAYCSSLAKNPRFSGEQLHVFDDFTWRKDWMDQYVSEEERLPKYECFRPLWIGMTGGVHLTAPLPSLMYCSQVPRWL